MYQHCSYLKNSLKRYRCSGQSTHGRDGILFDIEGQEIFLSWRILDPLVMYVRSFVLSFPSRDGQGIYVHRYAEEIYQHEMNEALKRAINDTLKLAPIAE